MSERQPAGNRFLRWGKRLLWANMIFSFLFLYLPIAILVAFSFNDSRLGARWVGFTTHWYVSMLESEAVLTALENSLIVAFVSTIIATILGTMTAMAMERFRFRFQRTYDGILYLPVIIPDIVMAISLLAFFFALRDRKPRLARAALVIALILGSTFALGRMMQGAHFLSHNLWTLAFDWVISVVCYRLVLYRAPAGLTLRRVSSPLSSVRPSL